MGSGSADGACHADDLDCYNDQDRLGMEAIRSLHRQLDDDDNGNIDLSESDDVSFYYFLILILFFFIVIVIVTLTVITAILFKIPFNFILVICFACYL